MGIQDLLAGEQQDFDRSRAASLQGRGRSAEARDIGNAPAEPIYGERVRPIVERPEPAPFGGVSQPSPVHAAPGANRAIAAIQRKPFGGMEQSLVAPKRDGYRRYWFNDEPGRVARAQEAGYTHVMDPVTGQPERRIVDRINGQGMYGYLMEIPSELYQEDMQRQADALAFRLGQIKAGNPDGSHQPNQYVPQRGITIERR